MQITMQPAPVAPGHATASPDVSAERSHQHSAQPEDRVELSSEVKQLEERDREVRRHEQAHLAAAGAYARGGAQYTYTTGPNGKQYAVGGEVQIDTSEVEGDPQKTIEKARTIRRAALAPEQPSSQDRAVAAEAAQMEARARQELRQLQKEGRESGVKTDGESQTPSNSPSNQIDAFL